MHMSTPVVPLTGPVVVDSEVVVSDVVVVAVVGSTVVDEVVVSVADMPESVTSVVVGTEVAVVVVVVVGSPVVSVVDVSLLAVSVPTCWSLPHPASAGLSSASPESAQ
jgi:hypothetical protein